MAKQSMWGNFFHALVAVLAGNAAYLLLMPHLPLAVQHRTSHYDLGLVVDFLFCLVALGLVKMVNKWGTRKSELRSQK